jgi:dCTP deaminase
MIWGDRKIIDLASGGGVCPYQDELVNPASIDLRLGSHYRTPLRDKWSDPKPVPKGGLRLANGGFILMHTLEYISMPDNAVGMLCLKSTTGRRGLEHLHAGYIDPGFCGQITLEITCHWPAGQILRAGDRFCQLVLADTSKVDNEYGIVGHYQGQMGPTPQWV